MYPITNNLFVWFYPSVFYQKYKISKNERLIGIY